MAKTYKSGLVLTGDTSGAIHAVALTENPRRALNSAPSQSGQQRHAPAGEQTRRAPPAAAGAALKTAGASMVAAGFSLFTQQLDEMDKLHKLNLLLGASVEALSEYQQIARWAGTDMAGLSAAWQNMSNRVSEAAAGTGAAQGALARLGVDVQKLNKMAPEDQFEAIAKQLEHVENHADRARLANEIFGKNSAAALQIINQGTKALEQQRQAVRDLGLTLNQDQVTAVANLNDALTNVDGAIAGVTRQAAAFAGVHLTGHVNNIAQAIAGNLNLWDEYSVLMTAVSGGILSRLVPAVMVSTAARLKNTAATRAQVTAELAAAKAEQAATAATVKRMSSSGIATASAKNRAAAELAAAAAQDRLTAATGRYNRVAKVAGRVGGVLSRGLALLGGSAGVAILAGTAILAMAQSYETAEERINRLRNETDELVKSLKNATLFEAYAAADKAAQKVLDKQQEILLARARVENLKRNGGGRDAAVASIRATKQEISNLKDEFELLRDRSKKASAAIDRVLVRNGQSADDLTGSLDNQKTTLSQLYNQYGEQRTQLQKLKDQLADVKARTVKGTEAEEQKAAVIKGLTAEIKKEEKALKALDNALNTQGNSLSQLYNQYGDQRTQLQKLTDQLTDVKARTVEGAEAEEQKAAVIKGLTAQIKKEEQALNKQARANQRVIEQLDEELRLLGLSEKERAIEINLKKLDAKATDEQRDAVRASTAALYEKKEQLKAVAEATKDAGKQVDPFAEAWESATQRIDGAFADIWKGAYDNFDDFSDRILDSFKTMLAEMAHQAITKRIVLNIQQGFSSALGLGDAASAAQAAAESGGGSLTGSILGAMSQGGAQIAAGFGNFATSSLGQRLGLSEVAANSYLGEVGLTGAGEFIKTGLNYSPWGMAGSLLAAPLGISGSGNALVDTGLSLAGSVGGGALGSSISALGAVGGPVGAALGALAGIAFGGLFAAKPSDKTQWGGFTGADNHVYNGGASGEKYSEENRNAATKIAQVLSTFDLALDKYSGVSSDTSYQVTVGDRDGIGIKADSDITRQHQLLSTPNGSADLGTGDVDVYGGSDLNEALDAAVRHMAEQSGVLLTVFESLQQEGEPLAETYERLNIQLDAVNAASTSVGLQFSATGDEGLRLADQLVQAAGGLESFAQQNAFFLQNFFSVAERQRPVMQQSAERYAELNTVLADNGLAAVRSAEQFKAVVTSLDVTTEQGAKLRAQLLGFQQTVLALEPAQALLNQAQANSVDVLLTLQQENEDFAATLERLGGGVELANTMARQLGVQIATLGDAGLETLNGMTTASGGLQQLTTDYQFYVQNILSSEQQQAIARADAQSQLAAWNKTLGLSGVAAIDTAAELQQYIMALNVSGQAQGEAYATALGMSQAIKTLSDQQAAATVQLTGDAKGAWQTYQQAAADADKLAKTRRAQLDSERRVVSDLLRLQSSLALSNQSILTPKQRFDEARTQYRAVLAAVQGGATERTTELDSIGKTYLTEAQSMYGSSAGAVAVYNEVSQALGDLAHALDDGSFEERQLELERDHLDELDRIRSTLEQQLRGFVDQSDTLTSINELLSTLPDELANNLRDALNNGNTSSTPSSGSNTGGSTRPAVSTLPQGTVADIYQRRVHRSAAGSEVAYWRHHQSASSWTTAQLEQAIVSRLMSHGERIWADSQQGQSAELSELMQKIQDDARRKSINTLRLDGSHRDGLYSVPFDGYLAELHRNEMVVPALQAERLRQPLPLQPLPPMPAPAPASNAGVERRLEVLTDDLRDIAGALLNALSAQTDAAADSTRQLARTLTSALRPVRSVSD